ncbi:enoyl-[acyl-carrier-protein] reductase, mitochondrial-like isoform X2 [Planococcus citri]|uniref:enoyl-[acyl-carrier-protein] reductase, mitochondrial-like isoform X2 n=1 Tax=Planococcus citri TaxID=170843 RepID=UPI0031F9876D
MKRLREFIIVLLVHFCDFLTKINEGRLTVLATRIDHKVNFVRSNTTCTKLVFEGYGDPLKVLKLQNETLPPVQKNEVLVKFHIAPVNPADINLIQGVYPVPVQFPAVGGTEGVGEILEVGDEVEALQPGDKVIPNIEGFGIWRNYGVYKSDLLYKVPKHVNNIELAGIASNPCTAYRMLKDFVTLNPGDSVIQNGGNSACGQNVIQLCRILNYTSISIVRNRTEIDELKSYLKSLGANYVFTEDEIRSVTLFKDKKVPEPKLGLNCVGGRSVREMVRHMSNQSVLVTYGGMSREPVTIPTSSFIFKNISLRGYWMTRWTRENKVSPERQSMFEELANYMHTGKLKAPVHKIIPLSNFSEAIMKSSTVQGFTGCKYLLDLQK